MRSTLSMGLVAVLMVAVTSNLAYAGGKGERRKDGKRGHVKAELLAKFDANKDGRLNRDERQSAAEYVKTNYPKRYAKWEKRAEKRKERLAQFDTNKDGKLNRDEKKAALAHLKETNPTRYEKIMKRKEARKEKRKEKHNKN